MRNIAIFGGILSSLLLATSAAADPVWKIVAAQGEVRVTRPGSAAENGTIGDALPAGTTLTSSSNARIELSDGAQRIVMGGNARMTIAANSSDAMTRIVEDLGAILFQVDKRAAPHFRVDAPLMAAVVKGTTFTVTSGTDRDMVAVAEGLVAVKPHNGGASFDVPGGAAAEILRESPDDVKISAATPTLAESAAPAVLPPVDYSAASDGLVTGAEDGKSRSEAEPKDQALANSIQDDSSPSNANKSPAAEIADARNSGMAPTLAAGLAAGAASNGRNGGDNGSSGNSGSNSGNGNSGSNSGSGNGNSGSSSGNGSSGSNSGNGNSGKDDEDKEDD